MGLWSTVEIEVRDPKNQNISKVVEEILNKYDYDETWFTSIYTKEKGVLITLRSTSDITYILPIILDIKKAIKSFSYFQIGSYLL